MSERNDNFTSPTPITRDAIVAALAEGQWVATARYLVARAESEAEVRERAERRGYSVQEFEIWGPGDLEGGGHG